MIHVSLPPDSELRKIQSDFTQHLRNPDLVPVPEGLDPRRMGIYSELIFNNVSTLMREFYPVINSITSSQDWDDLIREFFITHKAETPYFPKLSDEFLEFLTSREGNNQMPDYLLPLAHYEWLELFLFILDVNLPDAPLDTDTLKSSNLKLNALAVPVSYQFPVHQIRRGWKEEAKPTYLLVFRDQTDTVRFFELQPLAFELLNDMQCDAGIKIIAWLNDKAQTYNQDIDSFMQFGLGLIEQFNQERLILRAGNRD